MKQNKEETKAKAREYSQQRSARLKAEGLCTRCGKEPLINAYHGEKCHAKYKARHKCWRDKRRNMVLNHYGAPYCACCGGKFDYAFLQLDHIGGWGAEHRKRLRGDKKRLSAESHTVYLDIIRNNFPSGFRVLCTCCNFADGHGKCPHQVNKENRQFEQTLAGLFSCV